MKILICFQNYLHCLLALEVSCLIFYLFREKLFFVNSRFTFGIYLYSLIHLDTFPPAKCMYLSLVSLSVVLCLQAYGLINFKLLMLGSFKIQFNDAAVCKDRNAYVHVNGICDFSSQSSTCARVKV